MKGEVRAGTRHRRLTIFVVAVSAAQALLWSVSSARDFGVLRAVLAVAFIGITIVGVIVLVRERGHQRPL
jgi:hypothetical protein